MARIFINPTFIKDQEIILTDKKTIHYIIDVLRLKKQDGINIFNGKGNEYTGKVKGVRTKEVVIEILQRNTILKKLGLEITLIQALSKKNSFELIIEKATELGVNKIIPIITERTIPDISKKSEGKLKRWQTIAEGAARQCGRSDIPKVFPPIPFKNALKISGENELNLFACIDERTESLKKVLKQRRPKKIVLFVGPEGDFTKEEILKAQDSGYRLVSLGDNILRVETAVINLISIIRYEFS